jgi:thymidylate synthase
VEFIYLICKTKIKHMEKEVLEVDNRDQILEALKADRRSIQWLSDMTEIPYMTLYSCLSQRLFKVSEKNLEKINTVLGTDFK